MLTINLRNIKEVFKRMPRIEPRAAGCKASTLSIVACGSFVILRIFVVKVKKKYLPVKIFMNDKVQKNSTQLRIKNKSELCRKKEKN